MAAVSGGPLSVQLAVGPVAITSPVGEANQVLRSGEYST